MAAAYRVRCYYREEDSLSFRLHASIQNCSVIENDCCDWERKIVIVIVVSVLLRLLLHEKALPVPGNENMDHHRCSYYYYCFQVSSRLARHSHKTMRGLPPDIPKVPYHKMDHKTNVSEMVMIQKA